MTKKPENSPIEAKIAKLAEKIADEASEFEVALPERIDAFKALTTYYVNTTKINNKPTPDDEEEPGFANYRKRIETATSGPGSSDPGPTTKHPN
jgi:hypothetical protein